MLETLLHYVRAGFAGLYLRTAEEQRVEALLLSAAQDRQRKLFVWSCTEGLRQVHPKLAQGQQTAPQQPITDPVKLLARVQQDDFTEAIVLLRDFHEFLQSSASGISVRRSFRDAIAKCRDKKVALVIVAPRLVLPPEIEKDVTVLDFALPGESELGQVLDFIAGQARVAAPHAAERRAVLDAAKGLTTIEAQDVFSLSLVARNKVFDARFIAGRKAEAVKRVGLLEYYEPEVGLADVGGLENVKEWLRKRRRAFTDEARVFGLPIPKGLLIMGLPGTGKSLTAKAISSEWNLPLLRMDVGAIFGSLVGQSEGNLRSVLSTAEGCAPCVLWLDEAEQINPSRGSIDDTAKRVFKGLMTWMQERRAPVFVVATANDISGVPPEFLRRGRLDEIFFVDLHGEVEREVIWRIQIGKYGRDPQHFDLAKLRQATRGWVGAEIEQAVIDGLYEAFSQDRELEQRDLDAAVAHTVPLSETRKEDIGAMREWARGRAIFASPEETDALPELQTGRAIELE